MIDMSIQFMNSLLTLENIPDSYLIDMWDSKIESLRLNILQRSLLPNEIFEFLLLSNNPHYFEAFLSNSDRSEGEIEKLARVMPHTEGNIALLLKSEYLNKEAFENCNIKIEEISSPDLFFTYILLFRKFNNFILDSYIERFINISRRDHLYHFISFRNDYNLYISKFPEDVIKFYKYSDLSESFIILDYLRGNSEIDNTIDQTLFLEKLEYISSKSSLSPSQVADLRESLSLVLSSIKIKNSFQTDIFNIILSKKIEYDDILNDLNLNDFFSSYKLTYELNCFENENLPVLKSCISQHYHIKLIEDFLEKYNFISVRWLNLACELIYHDADPQSKLYLELLNKLELTEIDIFFSKLDLNTTKIILSNFLKISSEEEIGNCLVKLSKITSIRNILLELILQNNTRLFKFMDLNQYELNQYFFILEPISYYMKNKNFLEFLLPELSLLEPNQREVVKNLANDWQGNFRTLKECAININEK